MINHSKKKRYELWWSEIEKSHSFFPENNKSARNLLAENAILEWSNLRLIIQPTILLWLIFPWLDVFLSRHLLLGFHQLIESMNQFQPFYSSG